jgi:hypothetical protein
MPIAERFCFSYWLGVQRFENRVLEDFDENRWRMVVQMWTAQRTQ